ncbi:MAG: hypothetical protein CHACPFDD_03747 [Phycisphaerae bacterium]|nr:hypothetical protein [Phycisphaerae bacterium]
MSERRYEQAVRNARRWPIGLLGASPMGVVLRRAARSSRTWQRVSEAWARVIEPEWETAAAPAGVEGDVLVVAVAQPALRAHLERRGEVLARQVARIVPMIRRVRFVPAGQTG